MPAVTWSKAKDFRLIRPLVYVNEETTKAWVAAKGTPIVVYKKHGKAGGWRGHARTHAHTPGGGARSLCVRGHHPPVPAAAPTKIPAGWVPTPGRRPPPPDRRRSASVVAISLFSCSHLTLALPISLLTPPPLAAHRRVHCLPQPPLPAVPGEGRGVRSMCVCVCVRERGG